MPPEWLKWELLLKPFRKKHCDFAKTWGKTHLEAFMEIRKAMSHTVVLHHMDYMAAAHPEDSGRPLEMFIDASD